MNSRIIAPLAGLFCKAVARDLAAGLATFGGLAVRLWLWPLGFQTSCDASHMSADHFYM